MTLAPEQPNLVPIEGSRRRRLAEDHLTFVRLPLGVSFMILVRRGYVTDGASVPEGLADSKDRSKLEDLIKEEYPLVSTRFDLDELIAYLIGTPWDMPRLLAAVPHDVLYGLRWGARWFCDRIYRKILRQFGYDETRTFIEYECIRLAGWRNWNAVTKEERRETEALSEVRFVLTRNEEDIARLYRQVEGRG